MYNGDVFIPFVDSSPVAEVRAASLAGLGDIGMNGQLLNETYGSYCFIGEIVTTADFPAAGRKANPLCTHCGRCAAACPTGALSQEGFNREKCRSHITQKKGELTEWEREQIRAAASCGGATGAPTPARSTGTRGEALSRRFNGYRAGRRGR